MGLESSRDFVGNPHPGRTNKNKSHRSILLPCLFTPSLFVPGFFYVSL